MALKPSTLALASVPAQIAVQGAEALDEQQKELADTITSEFTKAAAAFRAAFAESKRLAEERRQIDAEIKAQDEREKRELQEVAVGALSAGRRFTNLQLNPLKAEVQQTLSTLRDMQHRLNCHAHTLEREVRRLHGLNPALKPGTPNLRWKKENYEL